MRISFVDPASRLTFQVTGFIMNWYKARSKNETQEGLNDHTLLIIAQNEQAGLVTITYSRSHSHYKLQH